MVGRGSHDPCAKADMRILSEIVTRRSSVADVITSFYAMTEPRLPDTLEQIAMSGRFDAVVVQPHLLFEGRLNQAILESSKRCCKQAPLCAMANFRLPRSLIHCLLKPLPSEREYVDGPA